MLIMGSTVPAKLGRCKPTLAGVSRKLAVVCHIWLVSARQRVYDENMTKKEFSEAIAAQLRGIIAQKGISRAQVSERTGIPSRTLARYLNDPPQLTIDVISDIASAIEADLGDVIDAADKSLNN